MFSPTHVLSDDVRNRIGASIVEAGTQVELVHETLTPTPPGKVCIRYWRNGYFVCRFVSAIIVVRLH